MVNIYDAKSIPHGYLYHYTTQSGLLGIITKKKIWATNILYLNDSMELSCAIERIRDGINIILSSLPSEDKEFLQKFLQNLNIARYSYMQEGANIFVCSFSNNDKQNHLSQWRGYSPNGSGFSIGFDFNSPLRDIVEKQGFDLIKCVYDEQGQSEIANEFLADMLGKFRKEKSNRTYNESSEQALLHQAYIDFLRKAPMFKNRSFYEEDEWRLVSQPMGEDLSVHFREGKSMLIPYMEICLVDNENDLLRWIPEIWIGPTPNPELSAKSLANLLIANNVESHYWGDDKPSNPRVAMPGVKLSGIPYRVSNIL